MRKDSLPSGGKHKQPRSRNPGQGSLCLPAAAGPGRGRKRGNAPKARVRPGTSDPWRHGCWEARDPLCHRLGISQLRGERPAPWTGGKGGSSLTLPLLQDRAGARRGSDHRKGGRHQGLLPGDVRARRDWPRRAPARSQSAKRREGTHPDIRGLARYRSKNPPKSRRPSSDLVRSPRKRERTCENSLSVDQTRPDQKILCSLVMKTLH